MKNFLILFLILFFGFLSADTIDKQEYIIEGVIAGEKGLNVYLRSPNTIIRVPYNSVKIERENTGESKLICYSNGRQIFYVIKLTMFYKIRGYKYEQKLG
jgi:hypothetical protein